MKKTRLFAAFLAFLLVFSLLPAARAAQEKEGSVAYPKYYPMPEDLLFPKTRLSAGPNGETVDDYDAIIGEYCDTAALRARLLEEMLQFKDFLDISSFMIPYSARSALYHMIWRDMPEALVSPFASLGCMHVRRDGVDYLSSVRVYGYLPEAASVEDAQDLYASFTAAADELLEGVRGNDALSDEEKALILHDRLAVFCGYDYDNYLNRSVPAISYTAYGVFCKGAAVCQGYTFAYRYLLEQVGIESRCCESTALNHIWNIVEIDGRDYHVDVTWDDPVRDQPGRVNHDSFLRSTDGIIESGHIKRVVTEAGTKEIVDYDTDPIDTAYDDGAWWQGLSTQICWSGGYFWYLKSGALFRRANGIPQPRLPVNPTWKKNANSNWGNYAKLAQAGEMLLISLTDSVLEYDPVTEESRTVWEPELSFIGDYAAIYGFSYRNGVMTIAAAPGATGPNSSSYTVMTEFYVPAGAPSVSPAGSTIILEDDGSFGMRCLLSETQVSAWEAATGINALFQVALPGGAFAEQTAETVVIGGTAYRSLLISGISAKRIGDAVTVRSNLFSADDSYSVADACRAVIDSGESGDFVSFAKALLDYGKAANAHFGVGAAPSASYYTSLGSSDPYADQSCSTGAASTAKIVGTSVVASDSLCLKFYVRLQSGADPSALSVRVNDAVTDLALEPNGTLYTVLYAVPATEMDRLVKVEIVDAAGACVSNCYRDSVASYCAYVANHPGAFEASHVRLCRYAERFIAASVRYFAAA